MVQAPIAKNPGLLAMLRQLRQVCEGCDLRTLGPPLLALDTGQELGKSSEARFGAPSSLHTGSAGAQQCQKATFC